MILLNRLNLYQNVTVSILGYQLPLVMKIENQTTLHTCRREVLQLVLGESKLLRGSDGNFTGVNSYKLL